MYRKYNTDFVNTDKDRVYIENSLIEDNRLISDSYKKLLYLSKQAYIPNIHISNLSYIEAKALTSGKYNSFIIDFCNLIETNIWHGERLPYSKKHYDSIISWYVHGSTSVNGLMKQLKKVETLLKNQMYRGGTKQDYGFNILYYAEVNI